MRRRDKTKRGDKSPRFLCSSLTFSCRLWRRFQQLTQFLQLFLAQRLFNLFFGALIVDFAVVQLIRFLGGFSALAAGALKLFSRRWHTSTLNENSFSAAAARIFPSVPEEF
ncbi:hypothetical protein AK51_09240 [Serratia nematodiphila DZ0503SBS1]|nr:hypothetical protein AK51_09240 [Serratia nematodiphila DZ0503SBS1]